MILGTYKVIPKVDWTVLLEKEFGNPNWSVMYPLNNKGQPVGQLSPRLACKLFYDGVFIIKRGEENPKTVQDHIPEIAHKCFKKKQWRKQYFEGMRRVCCRLALGKGFRPNCVAEDVFVYALISMAHEMGWRRIESLIEHLPVSESDKDYQRVLRLAANDEVGAMIKTVTDVVAEAPSAAAKKKSTSNAAIANAKLDVRSWFNCYEVSEDHLFDHIVFFDDLKISSGEEDEGALWSLSMGSGSSAAAPSLFSAATTPGSGSTVGSESFPLGSKEGIRSHSSSLHASSSLDRAEKLYPGIGVAGRYQQMVKQQQQEKLMMQKNREQGHQATEVGGEEDETEVLEAVEESLVKGVEKQHI